MEWAGKVYDMLEKHRSRLERADREEESVFYRAFLNTGCLLNCDDSLDAELPVVQTIRKQKTEFAVKSTAQTLKDIEDLGGGEAFVFDLEDEDEDSDLDDGRQTDDEEEVGDEDPERWGADEAEDDSLNDVVHDQPENEDQPFQRIHELASQIAQRGMADDFMAGSSTGAEMDSGRASAVSWQEFFEQKLVAACSDGSLRPAVYSTEWNRIQGEARIAWAALDSVSSRSDGPRRSIRKGRNTRFSDAGDIN